MPEIKLNLNLQKNQLNKIRKEINIQQLGRDIFDLIRTAQENDVPLNLLLKRWKKITEVECSNFNSYLEELFPTKK